jgi:hypothetical protein
LEHKFAKKIDLRNNLRVERDIYEQILNNYISAFCFYSAYIFQNMSTQGLTSLGEYVQRTYMLNESNRIQPRPLHIVDDKFFLFDLELRRFDMKSGRFVSIY